MSGDEWAPGGSTVIVRLAATKGVIMSTLPTPKLDLLWPALLSAHLSLQQTPKEMLAAPFWSAADASYRSFKLRFMLVGRATSGDYDEREFISQLKNSSAEALIGRKELNRRLVETISKKSPFWRAFVSGSKSCGETKAFENSVWTNLAKIGFANKDVDDDLFHRQEQLAENTLRAELDEYNPTVVHFAVGKLGGQCILRATGTKDKDWDRLANDGPKNDIWFLNSGKFKAVWTRHPNWATKELVQAWTAKLQELIEA
jgi:hypothetical protein